MKIKIYGIDDKLSLSLYHLAVLFFEDVDFVQGNSKVDFSVIFERKPTEIITKLVSTDRYHEETIIFSMGDPSAEKYAILRGFLLVLQRLTGRKQSWGVLTGVRPTKLWHSGKKAGKSPQVIKAEIQEKYLVSDQKLTLIETIVERQLMVISDLYGLKQEVSIYIGIPFCPTKCAYCTFPAYAIGGQKEVVSAYLDCLHQEMQVIGNWLSARRIPVTTIYFGGGTPTSISAEQMDKLYQHMKCVFPFSEKIREITVEAGRPDTLTIDKLAIMQKWNIDRISINPQSFQQQTLQAIGRHHTVEEVKECFQQARQLGFRNINMDLIIGLPNEGLTEFQQTLTEIAALQPESLTVHTLAFKRASEMTQNKAKFPVAAADEIEKMMQEASEWTRNHQYLPYYLYRQQNILGNLENIGYAKSGQESLYNILIMEEEQTILGLGCGAASKYIHPETHQIFRSTNPKDLSTYMAKLKENCDVKIKYLAEIFRA